MAEPHSTTTHPPSSSSSSMANRDTSGAEPSSSSSSRARRVEENRSGHPQFRSPDLVPQNTSVNYRGVNWSFDDASSIVRDDTWSCIVVLFTFWFFVSMTMILGVYGSMNLLIGPNSSVLLQPNPIFVQYIKVENLESTPGAMLYGTYGTPPLDVYTVWTETRNVSIPSGSHEEWKYYLNRASQVNISYRLSSESSSIFLVIAEGNEGLSQWLEEPTYPNITLSWNIIYGTGMITQDIFRSSSYYVAVGNLNEEVEGWSSPVCFSFLWWFLPYTQCIMPVQTYSNVELHIRVRASLYNTTNAYYKCTLNSNPCGLSVFFPDGNAAVLTSPGPQQYSLLQNTSSNEWYVKVSYGPRWVTYIFGIGGMTLLMFLAFNYLNKLQCAQEHRAGARYEETASQSAPLLSHKDDDLSSWGSSYESVSQDEEDLDLLTGGSIDGKTLGDGETSNNTRRLCAICFDAPRDCFFLPCGHCVACFECATRIAEAAGTCPVCHRSMKKVRKIFTV